MPCDEYKPTRLVIEIDQRVFDALVDFCKCLIKDFDRKYKRKRSEAMGECIMKIFAALPDDLVEYIYSKCGEA